VQQLLERDAGVVIVEAWRRKFIALVPGQTVLPIAARAKRTIAMDDRPS